MQCVFLSSHDFYLGCDGVYIILIVCRCIAYYPYFFVQCTVVLLLYVLHVYIIV